MAILSVNIYSTYSLTGKQGLARYELNVEYEVMSAGE